MNTDLTPKQQASEAVRQAESILIVASQRPNIDQASSMAALAMILRKVGKKVTALSTDGVPQSAQFIASEHVEKSLSGLRDFVVKVDLTRAEVDKLKYTIEDNKLNIAISPFKGGFNPSDVTFAHGDFHYDLIIALGVPSRDKLDRVFTQNPGLLNTPILNLDYHRINTSWGAINLVDTNAATLCEMLVSLSESLETGLIDEPIATAMLTGIIASTDRFSAPHTTAKAMTVAAQMMAAGAKQPNIIKALYGQSQRAGGSEQKKPQQNQPKPAAAQPQQAQPKPVITQPHITHDQPAVSQAEPVTPQPVAPEPGVGGSPVVSEPRHDVVPAPVQQPTPEPAPEVPTAPAHNPLEAPEITPEDRPEHSGDMSHGSTVDLPNEGEHTAPSAPNLNPYQA